MESGPTFWIWKEDPGDDHWAGIHMRFRTHLPWEWRGLEQGWVPLSGMVSPWWSESTQISRERAREFIANMEDVPISAVDVSRVSDARIGTNPLELLTDEDLRANGLRRSTSRGGQTSPRKSWIQRIFGG